MVRVLFSSLALFLATAFAFAQSADQSADSRTVLGGGNEFLSAGAHAIRAGFYDDGIRLTERGLSNSMSDNARADGLSNLCAAFAAKHDIDRAIDRCTESIALNARNWRAYSNRSYAFYLKGQYQQAVVDLEVAAALNPGAREVAQIRGMINERNLRPTVIVEEHQ